MRRLQSWESSDCKTEKEHGKARILVHPPASPTRLWSSFDFSHPEKQDQILVTEADEAAQGTN